MKQTEIFYKKIDDVIKITRIENVLSLKEIRKQFGNAIINKYKKGTRYYMSYIPTTVLYIKKEPFNRQVTVDSVMTEQEFNEIITTMKEAGERLKKIIAENKMVNDQDKKPEQVKSTEEQIIDMIKKLSIPALFITKKKIIDEIQRRTKEEQEKNDSLYHL